MSKLMNAENIHGLAPNRQFSLMPYSISELRGVSQRLNDGDKSGLRAVSHSSTLRGRTGDSIKLSQTTLDHSKKSFRKEDWTAEDKRGHNNLRYLCTLATQQQNLWDVLMGKICLLRGVLVNLLKLDSLSCSRNKWSCRTKQGWGVLSINCPLSLE